jgi:hypothetical protein
MHASKRSLIVTLGSQAYSVALSPLEHFTIRLSISGAGEIGRTLLC